MSTITGASIAVRPKITFSAAALTSTRQGRAALDDSIMIPLPALVVPTNRLDPWGAADP